MYNLGIIIVLIISNQPCATCWADLKSLADYSLSCIPLSPITICGRYMIKSSLAIGLYNDPSSPFSSQFVFFSKAYIIIRRVFAIRRQFQNCYSKNRVGVAKIAP